MKSEDLCILRCVLHVLLLIFLLVGVILSARASDWLWMLSYIGALLTGLLMLLSNVSPPPE